MGTMNSKSRFSRAQIAAMILIIMPVLLGAMALAADFAVVYVNWVQLQKAADAAALAGAQKLTGQPDASGTVAANAISYAQGYACLNGVNDPSKTSPGNENKQCQADVETYVPGVASGFIGKVIGASGISCSGTNDAATPNGVTLTMACVQPGGGTSCASRPVGTVVNIQMRMGTKNVLFLSKSATSFLGIPFPSQLTSTQSMLTQ